VDGPAAELAQALSDRRRIARYRRILVALLILVGGAVFVLTRFRLPALRRPIMLLAVGWCGLWLPTFRAVVFEIITQRRIDRLSSSPQRRRS